MNIRKRKKKQIFVKHIAIGGNAPISIQSMTNTLTYKVDATLKQIQELTDAGAEIIRLAVPTKKDTHALEKIIQSTNIPIVADVHFHFERAIEAIEAGAHKIRLNPGNLRDKQKLKKVISAAKNANIPIRIGINAGSIRTANELKKKITRERLLNLIFKELDSYVAFFEKNRFENLVLSAKSPSVTETIEIYRKLNKRYEYPLHLGLTHAGTIATGAIRSASAIAILLAEGIGDTIRVSLSGEPTEEIFVAKEILSALDLRKFSSPELICCPTCGRCEVDLPKLASQIEKRLRNIHKPLKIAIMGCIVNGPGEAADANIALIAGRDCGFIYVDGKRQERIKPRQFLHTLIKYIRQYEGNDDNE